MPVNIVLIEPEIPGNTGNIIRTCACTGANLHLIRPLGFSMEEKKLRRAGLDYLDLVEIFYYDNYAEFEKQHEGGQFFFYSTKASKNHDEVSYKDGCFLIFGKETKGIADHILEAHKESMVRIPMLNEERMRCLNLSNSVAIGVYEAIRQIGFGSFR
ncbi:tRNA (cytidine(34)-2'-O)-methyltransferase [Filifactor villosus]|uniref:Putative tRNA (cytidine(34)-2'-O)-methyltransferase n=1 Tax=Filifactor villosus TaxID=29374 RepID=A0ABV9QIJ2_9FIRM